MKEISFLILVLLFLSCKKEENNNGSGIHSCNASITVEPYLVGTWKLVNWTAAHHNTTAGFCDVVGSNTYVASDWGIEAYVEVEQNGIFRTYIGDSLVNESFLTRGTIQALSVGYAIDCQEYFYLGFRSLTDNDTLSNVQINDVVKIRNPFLDLNFANEPVWSITTEQQYVKIE